MEYIFSNESGEWKCEVRGAILKDENGIRERKVFDVSLSMAGVESAFEKMIEKILRYNEEN